MNHPVVSYPGWYIDIEKESRDFVIKLMDQYPTVKRLFTYIRTDEEAYALGSLFARMVKTDGIKIPQYIQDHINIETIFDLMMKWGEDNVH